MGVRVRIEFRGRSTETIPLVNTGFEGDVPEVLVPLHIAGRLGVWPRLPEGALIETYRSASGLMRVYRVAGARVWLVEELGRAGPVDSYLVISEYTMSRSLTTS